MCNKSTRSLWMFSRWFANLLVVNINSFLERNANHQVKALRRLTRNDIFNFHYLLVLERLPANLGYGKETETVQQKGRDRERWKRGAREREIQEVHDTLIAILLSNQYYNLCCVRGLKWCIMSRLDNHKYFHFLIWSASRKCPNSF